MAPVRCDMRWDCERCISHGCKFMQLTFNEYCVRDLENLQGDGYLVDDETTPCPPKLPFIGDDDRIEGINMGLGILFFLISVGGMAIFRRKTALILRNLTLLAVDVSRALGKIRRVLSQLNDNESVTSSSFEGTENSSSRRLRVRQSEHRGRASRSRQNILRRILGRITNRLPSRSSNQSFNNVVDSTNITTLFSDISSASTPIRNNGARHIPSPIPLRPLSQNHANSAHGPSNATSTIPLPTSSATSNSEPAVLPVSQPATILDQSNSTTTHLIPLVVISKQDQASALQKKKNRGRKPNFPPPHPPTSSTPRRSQRLLEKTQDTNF